MKKIYTLALGLAVAMTANAQDNVTNLTTGAGYPTLIEAFNAAESDNVLQVNDDISMGNGSRCGVKANYVYTIKGATPGVIVIIDGGRITNKNEIIALESANTVLNMANMVVRNVTTATSNVINLKNNNKYTVNLTDVKFEGSVYTNASANNCDIPVKSNTTLTLAGDNNLTIYYEGAATVKVADEGITNTTPIVLNVDNIVGKVAVYNCTDASKFSVTNPELSLVAKDGNLVVEGKSVIVTTSGVEISGLSNCNFATITDAVKAVTDCAELTEENEVVLTLYMNQAIAARQTFPANAPVSIVPAEGQDITINCTANNISFLVNNNANLTISGITLVSDDKNYNKHQIEVTSHAKLTLKDVVIKNMRNEAGELMKVTNGGAVVADNVDVSDCTVAQYFAFYGVSGCTLAGNTAYSICVEKDYNLNCADWTPAEVVDVYFSSKRNFDTTLLNDFTDVAKLNLMTEGYALEAKDGKIMVIDPENTGIDNVAADDVNAPVEYFNLQGVRVDNPTSGFYVKKQGNKVSKVVF